MADQYTPEEISEIFEAYNNAIKTGTPISAELAKQMNDASKGIKNYTDQVNASWKKLGTTTADLGKKLSKGEQGVGVFGDAVEDAAGALGTLAAALGPLSIIAKVAIFAVQAFAKGVNLAAKQGDALYKTYQDLGRVGATTATGITGVFENMQKLGYGIDDLDKMVALVTANAETLAKFSLTAADGTDTFAQAMAQIQRDGDLRLLGKTTDDINTAGAAFIKQQLAAGRTQKDIGDTLGMSTKQYVKDLDRLQRLTGTSADALQKQQDDALSEDAYNDVMAELDKRAAEGDVAAQAQIKKITTTMASLSPEMQKEFQRSIGGDISAQQKMFMRMPTLMKNVMDESVSVGQTMGDAKKDIDTYVDTFGRSYRLNADGMREFGGSLRSAREEAAQFGNFAEREAAAAKNTQVIDKGTKAITETQIANMNTRDALQSMVQLGVAPATVALNKLAGAAAAASGGASNAVGATGPSAATGGKAPSSGGWLRDLLGIGGKKADTSGLRIKSGEATAGGEHSESLTVLAQNIQEKLGGQLKYFSAFNDRYHQGLDRNSAHKDGRALDFTLADPSKAAEVAAMIRGMPGVKTVIDEYAKLSNGGTGGHIHAEVSARDGGIATGPRGGYQATLHGTEAIVPLPNGKMIPVEIPGFSDNMSNQNDLMSQQLAKLDELVRVMQNQVSVSTKILQQAS